MRASTGSTAVGTQRTGSCLGDLHLRRVRDATCSLRSIADPGPSELYLAEEKIEPAVVENMRSWEHSGFSRPSPRDGARQSVFLPAGDQAGIERLIQYMTRCPFSLSRLVKVSDSGQVVYQAEEPACRAFPDPKGDGMQAGVKRNFQILEPLDFLAEFTQHIPPKGAHLIRYYGWYSNKSRGMRKKMAAEASAQSSAEEATPASSATGSSQAWAMLIKRDAAYSGNAIDAPNEADESHELTYVDIDTFLARF